MLQVQSDRWCLQLTMTTRHTVMADTNSNADYVETDSLVVLVNEDSTDRCNRERYSRSVVIQLNNSWKRQCAFQCEMKESILSSDEGESRH